jgi:hypothetical protein
MTRSILTAVRAPWLALALLGAAAAAPAQAQFHHGPGWHRPGPGGPRYGVVVEVLPPFATLLTIGAVSYWYADGWYYRRVPTGYEVVTPPATTPAAQQRTFVYPKNGQSAEKQAADEYECHRWAVDQTRFDPTAQATGGSTDAGQREAYQRAQAACLEGRGYTVR